MAQQCNTHQLRLDVHDGALSSSHLHHPPRRIRHIYSLLLFHDGDEIGGPSLPPHGGVLHGGCPLIPTSLRKGSPRWEPLQPLHGDALLFHCIYRLDSTIDDGDDRTDYRIGHHNSCDA